MGNGTSQSIVLGSPRLSSSYPVHSNNYQYQRGVPKYVHPQNRVLPKPVAGQRLRSTDNGSILQTAGTIRGQRQDIHGREENVDPEMMGILRRRSEMIENENDCPPSNLRSHRMFYSDPDIARRISPDNYRNEEMHDSYGNRRSGGGVAIRTSKLKNKKKQKAPEPPLSRHSFPRELDRKPQSRNLDERNNQKNLPCRCINKNKAPQPPAINTHPPPPPPLPSSVTTRTKTGNSPTSKSPVDNSERSSLITRGVECHENKPSYEKKVHPLEKWRNCRSTGDVRIDEEPEDPSTSRTTVFNSKMVSENSKKVPSYLPQKPDPFQKEIEAVTKKIAESRQGTSVTEPGRTSQTNKVSDIAQHRQQRNSSPPKFYFADTEVFKKNSQINKMDSKQKSAEATNSATNLENKLKTPNAGVEKLSNRQQNKEQNQTTTDEIVPSLQRFSPARQRYKSPPGVTTPTPLQNVEHGWDELTKNVLNKDDEDSDIDIQLRPVLPRKPPDIPKFSPAEVWQSLGSDGQSSNQSTSDDGPDLIPTYKKNTFAIKATENRQRRQSEVPFGLYEKRNGNAAHKHRSMSDSHWTPRQDLLDDSDVSSIGSEDAVVPRIRTSSVDIPTRFSLPTVMFSNMRPIGSEYKTSAYYSDNTKTKHVKKKTSKPVENNYGMAPNFRKFLNKRNKYASEEDVVVSDSNWTFGQYGLQKRGKQYSSDLMLSEKKRHELMENRNFNDFLGDLLTNKANHMRDQMKSSDSGNSNFSFYSTEGQIMYIPEKGGFVKENDCSPPTKGRVYDIRRRFDPNFESSSKPKYLPKSSKKKSTAIDLDLGRKRDLELAKMLEDEVRKRRNKEKISIRQQLQKMKNMNTDDDEEDFDDEAYFTEPKSREESQSPFFQQELSSNFPESVFGHKPFRFSRLGGGVTTSDSTRLSHWQSSPALLEDSIMKNAMRPVPKGHFSSSSVMSSPDPETWYQQPTGIVNSWLQRQRNLESSHKYHLGSTPILEHVADEGNRVTVTTPNDHANDGDVSSSPTPVPQQKKKERRKTNIYKQLMDIVRKEEKQLQNTQRGDSGPNSRESSYSHCDSSPSTSSEASSTSSAYSYSDSSGTKSHGKNGVAANKEFHSSGYTNTANHPPSTFQMASVQPYTPSKGYRPVPFQVSSPAVNGCRMQGLQEERKEVKATAF